MLLIKSAVFVNEHLFSAFYGVDIAECLSQLHSHPIKLLFPFYRRENRGLELLMPRPAKEVRKKATSMCVPHLRQREAHLIPRDIIHRALDSQASFQNLSSHAYGFVLIFLDLKFLVFQKQYWWKVFKDALIVQHELCLGQFQIHVGQYS